MVRETQVGDYSGVYLSVGENSYTNRRIVGVWRLRWNGAAVTGDYAVWVSWEDSSSISYPLPLENGEVESDAAGLLLGGRLLPVQRLPNGDLEIDGWRAYALANVAFGIDDEVLAIMNR